MMFLFNIASYCKDRKDCNTCPYHNKENQKCLFNEEPRNYDLQKLNRAYARMALMEFGEDLSDEELY
jgi:rRNA maturation protein Rpf1